MAPRTDRTTRIPSGVASPVTTSHAAKGSVFVDLRNAGNLKIGPPTTGRWGAEDVPGDRGFRPPQLARHGQSPPNLRGTVLRICNPQLADFHPPTCGFTPSNLRICTPQLADCTPQLADLHPPTCGLHSPTVPLNSRGTVRDPPPQDPTVGLCLGPYGYSTTSLQGKTLLAGPTPSALLLAASRILSLR